MTVTVMVVQQLLECSHTREGPEKCIAHLQNKIKGEWSKSRHGRWGGARAGVDVVERRKCFTETRIRTPRLSTRSLVTVPTCIKNI